MKHIRPGKILFRQNGSSSMRYQVSVQSPRLQIGYKAQELLKGVEQRKQKAIHRNSGLRPGFVHFGISRWADIFRCGPIHRLLFQGFCRKKSIIGIFMSSG